MTTGEDENWVPVWRNKSTPPYQVLRIKFFHRLTNGDAMFLVYYRTFDSATHNVVRAVDELGAFVEAQKLMVKLRAKSERHRNRLRKPEKEQG